MPLSYPENTIWFVQASLLDGGGKTEGSAVAVRLQKVDEPDTAGTYLLTCAHVVRGKDTHGRAGYGRILPVIHAWPPDTGFTENQRRRVRIAGQIKAPTSEELAAGDSFNAHDDWVVLEFVRSADAEAARAVDRWADGDLSGRFLIYGFLGAASLPKDVVLPIRTPESFPIREEGCGAFCLTGNSSRGGFSGGGVFGMGGEFAGIHRGRHDGTLQLCGVSGSYIRLRLAEKGYELPRRLDRTSTGPWALTDPRRDLDEILGDPIASGLHWQVAYTKSLPRSFLYEAPPQTLADAVEELGGMGPDDHGVYPLFRFGDLFGGLDGIANPLKARLEAWLRIHCPAGQRELLTPAPAAKTPGEPRIVIQMTRDTDAEGAIIDATPTPAGSPPEEQYLFNTWFLGFPHSPLPQVHTYSKDGIVVVLEKAWMAVRDHHDPADVWVELFLPKHLFSWAVEKNEPRIAKLPAPVGARHRFVLRLDRGGAGRPPLETRYNKARERSSKSGSPIRLDCSLSLNDVPIAPGDKQHFMVAMDVTSDTADLISMLGLLQPRPAVLGVLWNSPPESSDRDDLPDIWDVIMESGVPLVMWLRDPPPPGQVADLRALFQGLDWKTLAGEVQRLRNDAMVRRAEPWHVGRCLAVILDDPERGLPSASRGARLRSPASTR